MKRFGKTMLYGALGCIGGLIFFQSIPSHGQPILFESQESKTKTDDSVFNEIRLISSNKEDIWMMRQSHGGIKAKNPWDRLAIVVNKVSRSARFYQLESGPLEWTENPKEVEFRASCFVCHSNGPRLIRPNTQSQSVSISPVDRVRLILWNLKIKSYGRLKADSIHSEVKQTPFRLHGHLENEPLKLHSCAKCHQESGLVARGFLTRQNSLAIDFMVRSGNMPPFPFSISELDKLELERFVQGN